MNRDVNPGVGRSQRLEDFIPRMVRVSIRGDVNVRV